MAENKEKPIEFYIFGDVYKFFMAYSQHRLTSAEWIKCCDEMTALSKKYKDMFSSRLIAVTYCHIVRCQEHFGRGSAWLEDLERRKEEACEAAR